jgi:hypothetical protein
MAPPLVFANAQISCAIVEEGGQHRFGIPSVRNSGWPMRSRMSWVISIGRYIGNRRMSVFLRMWPKVIRRTSLLVSTQSSWSSKSRTSRSDW